MQSAKLFKTKPQSASRFDPCKIPQNAKYDHVQAKIKTGTTVRDVELLTDARASKLNREIFQRISAKKLNLMLNKNTENKSIYIPSMMFCLPNPKLAYKRQEHT